MQTSAHDELPSKGTNEQETENQSSDEISDNLKNLESDNSDQDAIQLEEKTNASEEGSDIVFYSDDSNKTVEFYERYPEFKDYDGTPRAGIDEAFVRLSKEPPFEVNKSKPSGEFQDFHECDGGQYTEEQLQRYKPEYDSDEDYQDYQFNN